MANNHQQFIDFDGSVRLSPSKEEELKKNRKALREKIRKYFQDNKPDEIKPKFYSQGSFVMKTAINPIPTQENGKWLYKYDIDDGVYFIGNESADKRKTVYTYHTWIVNAVDGHTTVRGTKDKNTCVRVLYADGHHIDLPIYYKRNDISDSIPELADKGNGWVESDPQAFCKWFNEKVDSKQQLRRIVRYLKAWAAYKNTTSSSEMPSGFILTILATKNISYKDGRDDIALKETLENIQTQIDDSKGGIFQCYRPTRPTTENLFSEYSKTQKDNFLANLNSLIASARQAIEHKNPKDACLKWQKHLGDRFSCSTASEEDEAVNARAFTNPAIVPSNAKNA